MRTIVPGVRTLVLIFALSLIFFRSSAQSISTADGKFEVGLGLGPMFFLGDLGGNMGVGKSTWLKDVNLPLTKLSKGLYASIYPAEFLGFRLGLNQSMIDGYDNIIKDKGGEEYFRKKRNLEFRSNIIEFYGAVEFYPTVFMEQYDGLAGKLRPYGVIGIGAFHFNPQGRYYPDPNNLNNSQWVDLQPLHLEGQGFPEYPNRPQYSLTQMELPMGFGFKYYLKDDMYVGMEVLHRKTFTDYIDNVSKDYIDNNLFAKYLTAPQAAMANQLYFRENFGKVLTRIPAVGEQRGDPTQNDAFFSTIVRFGWRLNSWNSPNAGALRQLRCPSFY
jgi:hypothetical protein